MRSKLRESTIMIALYFVVCAALICCADRLRSPASALDTRAQEDSSVLVESLCIGHDPFVQTEPSFEAHAGYGSGVILDEHHVLTAFHVVTCTYLSDVHVARSSGPRFAVRVARAWPREDLAVLELRDASFGRVTTPRIAPPVAGAPACALPAYPQRGRSCGAVDARSDLLSDVAASPERLHGDVPLTMWIVPGNSGGGVYDARGLLIGIVVETNGMGSARMRSLIGKELWW